MTFHHRDLPQPPIEEMYQIAKQFSRRQEEVDDLVQDLLLEAVRIGKDFSDAHFMAWGRGFLHNHAAFIARTEGRRKKREEIYQDNDHNFYNTDIRQLPERFIAPLCQSRRILARLINCSLNRKEILYLLNISDTALRQRLTALRKEWKTYDASGRHSEHSDAPVHALPNGLMRQSLLQTFKNSANRKQQAINRVIGSHDLDGHLFIISASSAHKKGSSGNNDTDKGG